MIVAKGSLIGNVTIGNTVTHDIPAYEGEYNIVPSRQDQVLPTENKRMTSDLTVEKVPYFEVSNASGGTTAIIIKEE